MADIFSVEKRRAIMQTVRRQSFRTAPEAVFRSQIPQHCGFCSRLLLARPHSMQERPYSSQVAVCFLETENFTQQTQRCACCTLNSKIGVQSFRSLGM